MKKHLYFYRLHIKVWLLGILLLPTGLFGQGFSPATQKKLQALLDSFQNNPENPYVGGLSVAIDIDKLAFWKGATGYAARNFDQNLLPLPGGTPFTTDNLTRIYSITKTFTAALVLELVHEKKLQLDDRVEKYFPIKALNAQLDHTITIRQLLSHRSGFSDFVTDPLFVAAVASNPVKQWTPEEVVTFIKQEKPAGADPMYASSNYVILGAIAQKITGQSMAQLYRTRFFDPLGLKSMYFASQEVDREGLAAPHDNLSQLGPTFPPIYTNFSFFPFTGIVSAAFAGGGIVSDVEDVAKWGTALFTGRATSKATLQLMLGSISEVPEPDGDYLGYGLWTNTKISETDFLLMHNGVAPGYRSLLFHQPDKNITIAILSNYAGADMYALGKALYETLPDFTCGKKDNKVKICWYGLNLCLPDKLAARMVEYGGYVDGCEDCMEETGAPLANTRKELHLSNFFEGGHTSIKVYPNPLTDKATFSFSLAKRGIARLEIYNMQGRLVAELFHGEAQASKQYMVGFKASHFTAGMYISRLVTSSEVITQKLFITK